MTSDRQELGEGAWIAHTKGFIEDDAILLEKLAATLPLSQEKLFLFGREVFTPRLTSWHGDPGCAYRYSGRSFTPLPWTDDLQAIRETLFEQTATRFNSVLANLYRGGNDSMGAHSDDEPELGPAPDDVRIASVSLGAARRFCLRPKRPRAELPGLDFELGHGDLFVMGGTTQRHFRHHVPKTRAPVGPRLNLTFRVVRTASPTARGTGPDRSHKARHKG